MKASAWLKEHRLPVLAGSAAVLTLAGLGLIWLATARAVTIVVDGAEHVERTHARTVMAALASAGVSLKAEDHVQPGADTPLAQVERIVVRRARSIAVTAGGPASTVITPDWVPADILALAGWKVFPSDRIWVDGLPVADPLISFATPPTRVRLERGSSFTLSDGLNTRVVQSSATTLGEALLDAGMTLRVGDQVSPGLTQSLAGLNGARLLQARPITVQVDGIDLKAFASGPTVGEALAQAGVALTGLDRTEPSSGEPLPIDGNIRLIRVIEKVVIEQTPVPAPIKITYVADLDLDTQKVVDPGAFGMQANRVRVRYEDGQEISRVPDGNWLAVEPKPRTVGYGTRITIKTVDTPSGPLQYYRAVTVYATSYSPCRSAAPGGKCLYYTSSKKLVQRGVIGVTYKWYLLLGFGTPVYIPGYGVATIEDVGGGIPGRHWIDLGFSDSDYEQWGANVTLYFLTPVPPDAPVVLP